MAEHRQIAWNKKAAPYVTAALAVEVVGLFGFAYLTDSHVPGISPLAATSIFIDGTKDILPTGDPQDPERMRNALGGAYDQCGAGSTGPCAHNVYVDYPRDFGVLTGGVGYDVSRGVATDNTIQAIRDAQDDPTYTPGDGIYVVGYSQGANASSDVIKKADELNSDDDQTNDLDLSDVTFVMLGNGARNDGGLWSRLPAGVYVPFLGLDFGASTNPSDDPNAPNVLLITKQYDGAADWPRYVLVNPLAAVNAAMGFLYVHNGYYADTDIDLNDDGKVDDADVALAEADNEHYIVTKNGNVTDILIKNQPGDLPITQPLKALGVPDSLILAIDPLLRAMIDAGYDRVPDGGQYPSQPVHFGLIPEPSKMLRDFFAVAAGADQTGKNLITPGTPNPQQTTLGNALMMQSNFAPTVAQLPAPPTAPAKPHSSWPTFQLQQWIPPVTQQAPLPPADEKFVAATVEETPPVDEETIIPEGNSAGATQTPPRGPIGGSPSLPGLKKIVTSINGVVAGTVTTLQKALTPKPAGGTTAPTVNEPEAVNNEPDNSEPDNSEPKP